MLLQPYQVPIVSEVSLYLLASKGPRSKILGHPAKEFLAPSGSRESSRLVVEEASQFVACLDVESKVKLTAEESEEDKALRSGDFQKRRVRELPFDISEVFEYL